MPEDRGYSGGTRFSKKTTKKRGGGGAKAGAVTRTRARPSAQRMASIAKSRAKSGPTIQGIVKSTSRGISDFGFAGSRALNAGGQGLNKATKNAGDAFRQGVPTPAKLIDGVGNILKNLKF